MKPRSASVLITIRWCVIGDNIDNCKVMEPTAGWRGRLQGDGADCKTTRLIARRRGWLQGHGADCKAMGLLARQWEWLQGDGAGCKAMGLIARWWGCQQGSETDCKAMGLIAKQLGRLQGNDGAFSRKVEPYCWPCLGLPGGKTVRCFLVQLSKPKEVNRPYTRFYKKLKSGLSTQSFLDFCNFEYSKFLNSFLIFFLK